MIGPGYSCILRWVTMQIESFHQFTGLSILLNCWQLPEMLLLILIKVSIKPHWTKSSISWWVVFRAWNFSLGSHPKAVRPKRLFWVVCKVSHEDVSKTDESKSLCLSPQGKNEELLSMSSPSFPFVFHMHFVDLVIDREGSCFLNTKAWTIRGLEFWQAAELTWSSSK